MKRISLVPRAPFLETFGKLLAGGYGGSVAHEDCLCAAMIPL